MRARLASVARRGTGLSQSPLSSKIIFLIPNLFQLWTCKKLYGLAKERAQIMSKYSYLQLLVRRVGGALPLTARTHGAVLRFSASGAHADCPIAIQDTTRLVPWVSMKHSG